MRSHTRSVLLSLGLGLAAATLTGCASDASPRAVATQTPAVPATPPPPFDGATRAGALLLAAAGELDASILPAGFEYVETVDLDHAGSTSSIYVQGQPGEQGPGLYVHAMHAGVDVEHMGDDWATEEVPDLSEHEAVTVASDPDEPARSVVSIDATPAGTVRLVGDGVHRDELIGMTGRLLDAVG